MSDKDAQSYRNEFEALLRRAEDDGYRFTVELDSYVDHNGEVAEINTDYYFIDGSRGSVAFVDSSLIWEEEV